MRFTGLKDLDYKIMEELDIKSLLNFCRTDKYISGLCENDMFWKRRFEQRIGYGKYKPSTMTWKKYYLYLLSNEGNNPRGFFIEEPFINFLFNANFGNSTNEIRKALELPLKKKMLNHRILQLLYFIWSNNINHPDNKALLVTYLSKGLDILKERGINTEALTASDAGLLFGIYVIPRYGLSDRDIETLESAENRIMLNNVEEIISELRKSEMRSQIRSGNF